MPITIKWYDDTKTIVLWEFEGQWTLDELHTIYTESHNLCLTVPENTVIALLDMTRSAANSVPPNIFSALTARKRTQAPNFDMIVIVSTSSFIKIFVNILMKLPALRDQFALYETFEDALAFIEKRCSEREADTASPLL